MTKLSPPPPSEAELTQLVELVKRQTPELESAMIYLLGALRQLSELTLERLLASPQPITRQIYELEAYDGTSPGDLARLCRKRLLSPLAPSAKLEQILRVIEEILTREASAKVERLLKGIEQPAQPPPVTLAGAWGL